MFRLGRMRNYDRARILEAAAKARVCNKRRRAIALYRRVLAVERHDAEIHARVAPLLAETGQSFDAWSSFQCVARARLREGSADRALAVYREAANHLPREVQVWEAMARLQHETGRPADAVESLLEGSAHFRSRFHWPEAIHLLRLAHQISPWHFETVLALSRLLAKSDQGEEARRLLEGLEARAQPRQRRRIHAAQFRLDGDLRHAWGWLRCALKPAGEASYG